MKNGIQWSRRAVIWVGISVLFLGSAPAAFGNAEEEDLASLLPRIEAWQASEESQTFFPESLFEYINGAAEIYLSYDFRQLIVAQFQKAGSEANIGVEIYEMATPTTAFGIYSAERYPENVFIGIGQQGYVEEGTLNFLTGRYYVKLLCFDCGEETEDVLRRFAGGIVKNAGAEPGWPEALNALPEEGRIPNTEKFILKNFLGYGFLHDGYMATYRDGALEFDAFLIEGADSSDARSMLERFIEAKGASSPEKAGAVVLVRDRYYHNIYLAEAGRYLCGVMKIPDGSEKTGEKFIEILVGNTKKLK